MQQSSTATIPSPETPALPEEEARARRQRLVDLMFDPDGLDWDVLARIEQLTDDEQ